MVIYQCIRKLKRGHEMLRTEGLTDRVHSYNSLPTPWRGINKNRRALHFILSGNQYSLLKVLVKYTLILESTNLSV